MITKEINDPDGWGKYLSKHTKLSTLRTRPNDMLDMNSFSKCIVGRLRPGAVYFDKRYPEYCSICTKASKSVSEAYHSMIQNGQDGQFNTVVSLALAHIRDAHQ